jgi:hypothetical protein
MKSPSSNAETQNKSHYRPVSKPHLLAFPELPVRHSKNIVEVLQAQDVGQPLGGYSLYKMQVSCGRLTKEVNLAGTHIMRSDTFAMRCIAPL